MTIHKSQGSEFPAVVIPLATQHYMLLQRNLIALLGNEDDFSESPRFKNLFVGTRSLSERQLFPDDWT